MDFINKHKLGSRLDLLFLTALVLFSTVVYSFVGFQKHLHFQTFAWDTTVFIQQLYLVSEFKYPFSSLHDGMNALGDHFQIVFLLLGGIFFRIWQNDLMLFIFQGLMGSLSAIPLYFLGKAVFLKRKLKKSLVIVLSLLLCWMYLFSVSFQGMMTDEFHNEPIAAVFVTAVIYFLYRRNYLWYWISFGCLLLTKELYGLIAIPLAVHIILRYKDYKTAIITGFIGSIVFYVLLFQIMPRLSGMNEYMHFTSGNRPSEVLVTMITHPLQFITRLFDNSEKIKTLFLSVFSFGMFPILSPIDLIPALGSAAVRFYDNTTPRMYMFNNHYAVPLLSFAATAAVFGLNNFLNYFEKRKYNLNKVAIIVGVYLLLIIPIQTFVYKGALNSLAKASFYQTQNWEQDSYELIKQIPSNSSVSANNSLLPHLSMSQHLWLFPKIGAAEYIALDLNDGPNKFAPLQSSKDAETELNKIIENQSYKIIWQKNKVILLKKSVK